MSHHLTSHLHEAIAFRRLRPAFVLAVLLTLSSLARPASATPAMMAVDHDINWGALERHFPQNKQAESPMATNPTDALNSITGAIDFVAEPDCSSDPSSGGSVCYPDPTVNTVAVYTTADGGATWRTQPLDFRSGGLLSVADPTVAFGPKPDGHGGFSYASGARAYFLSMAVPYGNLAADPVIAVSSSDDKGLTWGTPTVATSRTNPRTQFNDKPMIWADNNPASPYFGSLYVAWAIFKDTGGSFFCQHCARNVPDTILFARSTDGGQNWSDPVTLSPSFNNTTVGYREGAMVRSDRDGRVIVAWLDTQDKQPTMVTAVSTDGGRHFGRPVAIGPVSGKNPLPGTSFPNFDFVALDVDQSTGALYAAWMDYTLSDATHGHGVMTVKVSNDHGQTWSSAGTIDVPGRTAFHPAIAVARRGAAPAASTAPGRVVVGFTALTDVPFGAPPVGGAVNYLPYIVGSDDGGASWSAPLVPSGAGPSDPAASVGFPYADFGSEFVGDYAGLSAAPDGSSFFFSYSSAQTGTPCAAVDAYRSSAGPLPNIYTSCPPAFGNTDIHVAAVTTNP